MRNIIFWILVFGPMASAQGQTPDTLRRIDQLFTRWNNATPGGVVTVERNGKIIYNKAFGIADLEHNVPNTTETIFEGGSLSKQFTATAILLLVAEGKLALSDDVRKYIPELPSYGPAITIQQLLNHTSGLKDWGVIGSLAGWPRTTRVYTQELALQIICKQKSLNFVPGSEYSYSNSNYSLLVTIVERITQQSLAVFTRLRLFEPTGMTHTKWRNNFREIIPNRSIGYSQSEGKYQQDMPFENVHGHGGVLTTTGDLIRWNRQLATHEVGGERVFQMRTKKGQLNNKKEISYASGLVIGSVNGFKVINHTGATAGYRAVLGYYPEKKLSIAILSNDGNFSPGDAGTQVAEIFLGKAGLPGPPTTNLKVSEESLKRYEGIYRSLRGHDVFTLDYSPGKILSRGNALQVLHPDTLYLDRLRWIAVKPGRLLLQNPLDTGTYVRVKPPVTDIPYLNTLVGEYVSDEAGATYLIELRGSELWVNQKPHSAFKLSHSFLDGFLSEDDVLFEFRRNKKGAVDRLECSASRAERVPFLKKGADQK